MNILRIVRTLKRREYKTLSHLIDGLIINELLDLRRNEDIRILDLGCGTGKHASNIAAGNANIVGLDIDLASVIRANGRFSNRFDTDHLFLVGDAKSIPLVNDSINYLICNAVLQHISYYREVIREVARIVKPGGVIIFGVLHKNIFEELGVLGVMLKCPVWIKRMVFSQYLLYSEIDLHKTKESSTLVQGSLKSLGIEQPFSLSHLKSVFSEVGLQIVDYQYVEKSFGKLAQRIKYMLKFGRSKSLAPLLYLLASIDFLLPRNMEGNTLFVKAIKK